MLKLYCLTRFQYENFSNSNSFTIIGLILYKNDPQTYAITGVLFAVTSGSFLIKKDKVVLF